MDRRTERRTKTGQCAWGSVRLFTELVRLLCVAPREKLRPGFSKSLQMCVNLERSGHSISSYRKALGLFLFSFFGYFLSFAQPENPKAHRRQVQYTCRCRSKAQNLLAGSSEKSGWKFRKIHHCHTP